MAATPERMASKSRPTTSSSAASFSLPGPLGNVLSWTMSRWNTHSSQETQETQDYPDAHSRPISQSYYGNVGSTTSLTPSEKESMSSFSNSLLSRHHPGTYTPPPLPRISLHGYSSRTKSHLMTRSLAEEIRNLIPARLQLYETWSLVYSLEQHGVSLHTLYQRCALRDFKRGGFVIVIKDDADGIFGAFVNESFRPSGRYYGTGECFLWKASWLTARDNRHFESSSPSSLSVSSNKHNLTDSGVGLLVPELQDRPSTPSSFRSGRTSNSRSGDLLRFKAFPYSGINDYMIYCAQEFLSVGGGDGKYGLWLDDSLEKGVSSTCPTFGNEQLSEEGEKFNIIDVEVWSIGAADSL